MATRKKKATPVVEKEKEAKVQAAPVEEKAPVQVEEKKKFTLKDLQKLEEKAVKLILKEDFDKIPELSDEPGLLLKGFRDTTGTLRLRVKYEKDGELLVNKISPVHNI